MTSRDGSNLNKELVAIKVGEEGSSLNTVGDLINVRPLYILRRLVEASKEVSG